MGDAVVAVIPSYRPEAEPLTALTRSLLAQDVPVVVVDDASPGAFKSAVRAAQAAGAVLVEHSANAGIARGLNDGLRWALECGAAWLLTVDQDSTVPATYVRDVMDAASTAVQTLGARAVGAVGAAVIDDASGEFSYPVHYIHELAATEELIQSGTLWSTSALEAIGGFDESLGIDAVDAAACVRLRASGRRLLLAPGVAIGHRVGHGRTFTMLGRSMFASGHSPDRRTTIVRNRLKLFPEEFAQSPRHAFRTLRRVAVSTVLAVTVEDQRLDKAKASLKGLLPTRRVRSVEDG